MEELKPCPFCGAKAFKWNTKYDCYVECAAYDASSHRVMVSASTEEKAVRLWNQRVVDERLEDDLK